MLGQSPGKEGIISQHIKSENKDLGPKISSISNTNSYAIQLVTTVL
jgi:hypothetical protein